MSIRVEGVEELVEDFTNAKHIIDRRAKAYLNDLGGWGVGRAKAYTLDAGAVDLGELVQGLHHKTKSTSQGWETTIRPSDEADKYAIYVERGTRPHFPPISKLQGWADRHGIPVWAVAKKIAREGTEPRWIFRNTFNDLHSHVESTVDDFLIEIVRQI